MLCLLGDGRIVIVNVVTQHNGMDTDQYEMVIKGLLLIL